MLMDYRSADIHGLVRLAGILRAGTRPPRLSESDGGQVNPISAQIRFLVIKLALNSLIRKVKESTEVFQIPPPASPCSHGGRALSPLC